MVKRFHDEFEDSDDIGKKLDTKGPVLIMIKGPDRILSWTCTYMYIVYIYACDIYMANICADLAVHHGLHAAHCKTCGDKLCPDYHRSRV